MSTREACSFSHWCWFIYPMWPLVRSFHVCSHFCSQFMWHQPHKLVFLLLIFMDGTSDIQPAQWWPPLCSSCSVSVWPDMAVPRLPGLASSTARLPRNSFCRLRPPHPQSPKEVEWQGRTGRTEIEKENVEIDWKETRMTGEIKDDTETSCHSKFCLGFSYVCARLHVCTWM